MGAALFRPAWRSSSRSRSSPGSSRSAWSGSRSSPRSLPASRCSNRHSRTPRGRPRRAASRRCTRVSSPCAPSARGPLSPHEHDPIVFSPGVRSFRGCVRRAGAVLGLLPRFRLVLPLVGGLLGLRAAGDRDLRVLVDRIPFCARNSVGIVSVALAEVPDRRERRVAALRERQFEARRSDRRGPCGTCCL